MLNWIVFSLKKSHFECKEHELIGLNFKSMIESTRSSDILMRI